ncbi:MAG: hypothetical protein Q7R98_03385 [Candidatus Jorgensenbacteria bacterium]|nr:hypothetical protein [Candidatus Jorgensenbacteria bacterium]
MKIIPSINCADKACAENRIKILATLPSDWVHIDVAEKDFAHISTWDEPEEFKKLLAMHCPRHVHLEVHIMAKNVLDRATQWMRIGAERIIVHPGPVDIKTLDAELHESEIGFAIAPDTAPETLIPYGEYITFIQVLAVPPGPSGQVFNRSALGKISFLREHFPSATIETDGGITPEIIPEVRKAGADSVVVGSYIFESQNPLESYRKLEAA